VGQAGSIYINPVALAQTVGGTHGSEPLPAERRERVEKALASLEAYASGKEPARLALVHDGSLTSSWLEGETDVEIKEAADPCLVASTVYDEKAAQFAEVFAAVRLAHLELSHAYDTALHDPWFANFNWEAFARQELMLLPVVAAVASADRIAGKGLPSLSRLLRSGRPVQILAEVEPSKNHGVQSGEDPFASYRLELGYLGISHREALVAQSSLARPGHLAEGFLQALDGTRTGLHLINIGEESPHLSAWLQAGAALDGRAHPFFRYNPEKGRSFSQSMDFSENPEPDVDWPRYPLAYQGTGEEQSVEVPFTFVDYALLDPALREHFRLVPEGLDRDEFTPVDAYLALEPGEAVGRLPVVWTVKGSSALRRAVISRELLLACQDRLGYWRTLQSAAGVRNEYADRAAQLAREQAMAEAAEEREKLEAAHAEEVARVREETAGEVMQHLTEVLMGLDLTQAPQPRAPSTTVPAPVGPAAEATAEAPAPAAEPEEEEEEAVSFDNPYIDTMLCTSCNDCMKINALVFLYNENKQAYLGDLKTASYKDLVVAAEKCPARCIHPGKPQNPDEPDLDELMERAKPFN
jgi:ferredoxin